MTRFENAKMKLCAVADKVTTSKAYKAVEKGAVALGAGAVAVGTMAMNSFAASSISLDSLDPTEILGAAEPFINAGIPILAVVGGLRLGMRFLRGSMH